MPNTAFASPVVVKPPAKYPNALFASAVFDASDSAPNAAFVPLETLLPRARSPTAVLLSPVVFWFMTSIPTAVLPLPVVVSLSEFVPTEVFWDPLDTEVSAFAPAAVFRLAAPTFQSNAAPAEYPRNVLPVPAAWTKACPPPAITPLPAPAVMGSPKLPLAIVCVPVKLF